MIRTQIQLSAQQAHALRRMAAREGKSVAELIRISVDSLLRTEYIRDEEKLRSKAIAAAGTLTGPSNLAEDHDDYLDEAMTS